MSSDLIPVAVLVACLVAGAPVQAEMLEPRGVEYDVEVKQDQEAAVCYLHVLLGDIDRSPEVVKFSLNVAASRTSKKVFAGFLIDVGDAQVHEGSVTGLAAVPLVTAAVHSEGFNSPGRLYGGALADGGVQMSTQDASTASDLAAAIYHGDFVIEFTRSGASTSRSYRVHQGPSVEMVTRYQKCVHDVIDPILR